MNASKDNSSGISPGHEFLKHVAAKYETLLAVSESIASHRDISQLFHGLAQRLGHVLQFDYLSVRLHDSERNVMRKQILETSSPVGTFVGDELPVGESLSGWVWQNQQPILIGDVGQETRFPCSIQILRENGIKSCCCLPLTTVHRCLGAIILGRVHQQAYEQTDLGFMEQVARQVAVAVDNALRHQESQALQAQLKHERDRLRLLIGLNNTVVSNLDLHQLLQAIAASIRQVMQCDSVAVYLPDSESNQMRVYALDFPGSKGFLQEESLIPMETSPAGRVFRTGEPLVGNAREIAQSIPLHLHCLAEAEGFRSICMMPLISRNRGLGVLSLGRMGDPVFTQDDVDFLTQVASQVAIAVENALEHREVTESRDRLAEQRLYLQEEIRTEHNFEEIIGESRALKRVLRQVETVAPTDSTVLILGETGTGKELIARAVHHLSSRVDHPLVKVNCAAIPTGLLESELFGHEKGAFTGAIAQKIGRFELAHRGTLFLDEVGDIPLELQPKLLRVLQEQEFERLGSTKTIRVNARLVAATNADLHRMVAEKRFRSDLYYRLNVIPILIPPLRERPEDIPSLVRYFVQKYSRLRKKEIRSVPVDVMATFGKYHWPGNIRELENIIERAVILSRGPDLRVSLDELKPPAEPAPHGANTLEEAERDHILKVKKLNITRPK
ncbi:MAG: sigma 54-interacting transcriptional regulator [Deltaproteobacteria bacterium]|nr:sigma 54-interacting transcriptional regulator [Deltaproteobacteria bacterium]